MVQLEQGALAVAHHARLLRFEVIVSEHVQDAVHDEQRQLVVERAGVGGGLLGGDGGAHHDIAHQHGDARGRRGVVVEGERQHVRRAGLAEVLSTVNTYSADAVELRDTLGPEHDVVLPNNTVVRGRLHVVKTYDQGAPSTGELTTIQL